MTRFAIQWPLGILNSPDDDFNGARQEFIRQHRPVFFLPHSKWNFTTALAIRKALKSCKLFNIADLDFAFSIGELNRKADILIHFNQYPLNLSKLAPPKGFNGLKVWHVFEYVFHADKVNRMMEDGGVDYVLGYADHGKYCPFFQKSFPRFTDRVIPYPFGASKRFLINSTTDNRIAKVIALGSINPVNEPGVQEGSLSAYADFYKQKLWTHEWRRLLAENIESLTDIMDSCLPKPPEMKNTSYNAVEMMTSYLMFANDEGLLAFPPARTYEGPAAGCVMIGSDFPGYADLGFRDGRNCILHRKHDINDFRSKATYWLERPSEIARISDAGKRLVHTHYTHSAVARRLGSQLEFIYRTGRRPETSLAESEIPN